MYQRVGLFKKCLLSQSGRMCESTGGTVSVCFAAEGWLEGFARASFMQLRRWSIAECRAARKHWRSTKRGRKKRTQNCLSELGEQRKLMNNLHVGKIMWLLDAHISAAH